jgi:YjbE family integral membrane protein
MHACIGRCDKEALRLMDVFDPAWWSAVFQAIENDMAQPTFWLAVLQIIWINILLSGDNAVVIAMACRGLPPTQRKWGLLLGAGVAVGLRIVFTMVVSSLMTMPYLKLVGGLALLYIAIKLLVPDEEADESSVGTSNNLWRAVRIVAMADIIMSLDNVIAIAAAAKGSVVLLVLGLSISVPLIIAGAALIMSLLDRFPVMIWAGAALLGWIAGEVIATDPAVHGFIAERFGQDAHHTVGLATAAVGSFLVVTTGWLWHRSRESEAT